MRRLASGGRQQALALAELEVLGQAQRSGGLRADDATEFFEQGVGIEVAERLGSGAVAVEPAAEGIEADLPAGRHLQGFEELAVAQKLRFLVRVLVAVRVVQRARRLREVGRLGDVQHPP